MRIHDYTVCRRAVVGSTDSSVETPLAWRPLPGYAHELSFTAEIGRVALMQLRMSTRSIEGVLVVDCSGRLVFGEESASLRDTVKKLLAESPKVVMNLREINYIDSGGLGTLVSLYTTCLLYTSP